MADMQVRVSAKWPEARDIAAFELTALDGAALPGFEAGAHIEVHLDDGQGKSVSRSYSLAGNPQDLTRYELGVLLEPDSRGGSAAMHALREGDVLAIDFPRNRFALAAPGQRHALFAGGVGITPMLAMASSLQSRGDAFDLFYAVRSRGRAAYLTRLQSSVGAALHLHVDDEAGGHFDASAALATLAPQTHVYVCGPKAFMDAVLAAARASGVDTAYLHWEYFSNDVPLAHDGDGEFELRLQHSGQRLTVAAGQTIVQACAQAGVDILVSCEQGVCGTCITSVLEGIPDHRDVYLSAQEKADGKLILPCCSRAKSPILVLDL